MVNNLGCIPRNKYNRLIFKTWRSLLSIFYSRLRCNLELEWFLTLSDFREEYKWAMWFIFYKEVFFLKSSLLFPYVTIRYIAICNKSLRRPKFTFDITVYVSICKKHCAFSSFEYRSFCSLILFSSIIQTAFSHLISPFNNFCVHQDSNSHHMRPV